MLTRKIELFLRRRLSRGAPSLIEDIVASERGRGRSSDLRQGYNLQSSATRLRAPGGK